MFDDPQSSDEESPVPDADSCDPHQLQSRFKSSVRSRSEVAISLKRTCGLHLSLSSDSRKLAVGSSRKELQLYQLAENGDLLVESADFDKFKSPIRGVRFFNGDPNMVMACAEEGVVSLYDLRLGKSVFGFEDGSEGVRKTMTTFDLNQNDRVLCASTEVQKGGDSFLLFFDIRERKFLGSYWECHSEDITNVRFHPSNPDLLVSGSVDGLINVFDISQPTEDDAMQYCFNVDTAIESLNWHRNPGTGKDWVSCVTTTNGFQLYDVESQDPEVEFDREKITEFICRKSSIDCNVVGAYNEGDGALTLLAGSNYNKGECLRSLRYSDKSFQPFQNFLHNKQIVRASVYSEKVM
ncbi:hypothetical protein pipiens_015163 [Culex pipiens pipiens]|uniref:WD repeat-containing protein 89 n=1 Tax=Culex pipiens pipiens TaxID=38569 RepID=A0ABD1CRN9_CULPP